MQKHIYFSPISNPEEYEPNSMFHVGEGKYDFKLEINMDAKFVRLYDSIGRMIPIDYTQLHAAIQALQIAEEFLVEESTVFCLNDNGTLVYEE